VFVETRYKRDMKRSFEEVLSGALCVTEDFHGINQSIDRPS